MSGTTSTAILIHNEQTKLYANAPDRASTTFIAAGIFPLINAWRSSQPDHTPIEVWIYIASAYMFGFAAWILHRFAKRSLRGLR